MLLVAPVAFTSRFAIFGAEVLRCSAAAHRTLGAQKARTKWCCCCCCSEKLLLRLLWSWLLLLPFVAIVAIVTFCCCNGCSCCWYFCCRCWNNCCRWEKPSSLFSATATAVAVFFPKLLLLLLLLLLLHGAVLPCSHEGHNAIVWFRLLRCFLLRQAHKCTTHSCYDHLGCLVCIFRFRSNKLIDNM